MRKFEAGKRYEDSGITFEITGRTEKTVKFIEIQHVNRFNEKRSTEKKAKIRDWGDREVFLIGDRTIEA